MKTMTVRNMPEAVAEGLSRRAAKGLSRRAANAHTSVNSIVVTLLSDAVLGGSPFSRKRNLSEFCGTWSDAELAEFEAATESTRRIEPEDWK